MVTERKRTNNPKKGALDPRRVRAGLIMNGHTVASFARAHGVSRPVIYHIIAGDRPARSGKSALIRRQLEQVAA